MTELVQFFLALQMPRPSAPAPTRREAEQIVVVMEPIAKDGGSQLFLQVGRDLHIGGDLHIHHHYSSQEANAVQNSPRRYLGPRLPAVEIRHDALLRLHQVRGDPSSKSGDRGIIEEVSPVPVKLIFSSEQAKLAVLEAPYPFASLFVVDVEVKSSAGRPALYRVLTVKDTIGPVIGAEDGLA